ncbi:hypothetical protein [Xanthomonas cucurbitae]|uniref:Uncharacterized protein n=1 Tax=Xanthomonas cucurbitae TaxID=56453 RepID=A0ABY7YHI2_9XANT|nr:hypothetical protein [Xanthomonas cucurbitae]WDM73352.1 hypothetical protein K6978_09785 [Xanthomonas cucurbitae]WDM73991.1 hypothetical protein K6982_11025 [Xanthomonas cucurbitae]WDM77508.1 hypothetical protein K6980_09520 [Xanthomonas cucurbitae]
MKNFFSDSKLAHFWLFFTRIPADPRHRLFGAAHPCAALRQSQATLPPRFVIVIASNNKSRLASDVLNDLCQLAIESWSGNYHASALGRQTLLKESTRPF